MSNSAHNYTTTEKLFIKRPSSLGGGRILRRTVCLSVIRPVIVAIGNVFSSTASVTDVFSARTEGRISYSQSHRLETMALRTAISDVQILVLQALYS